MEHDNLFIQILEILSIKYTKDFYPKILREASTQKQPVWIIRDATLL